MTDTIKEQVSALVDGELPAAERDMLFARMEKDEALAGCWERYHLMSDVLRRQMPEFADKELVTRVHAALAAEQALHESRHIRPAWLKPVAGLAIAASVALVAVLAVRSPTGGSQAVPPVASSGAPAGEYVRVDGTRWNIAKPKVADRLNAYLVNHNEFAGSNGVQGMLPYSRIVGYDTAPE